MKKIINKFSVVVFDLDDTLYSEYDYNISGIKAVAKEISDIYSVDLLSEFMLWHKCKEIDIFGLACKYLGLPVTVKESLLWIYRLHNPDIILNYDTQNTLNIIRQKAKEIIILTDGRSISQRKKINSLGLGNIKKYISEEYMSSKPDYARFKLIMKECPANKYIYIGDNPEKDFIAPKALGWTSIGLKAKSNNIHSQDIDIYQERAPDFWIKEISDLNDMID